MNWLTREQIQAAAAESETAAAEMCVRHWRQMREATEEELRKGWKTGQVCLGSYLCALCARHIAGVNGACSLKQKQCCCGCVESYIAAHRAWMRWLFREEPHSAFLTACNAMIADLEQAVERAKAMDKKAKETS